MINPYMILGGVGVIVAAFTSGFTIRGTLEKNACDAVRLVDHRATNQLVNKKEDELVQCRAQVDGFNLEVARQTKEILRLEAEQARRDRLARKEASDRAAESRRRAQRVEDILSQLKEDLENADFGVCAGEPVPDDYIGLLNDALAAARTDG